MQSPPTCRSRDRCWRRLRRGRNLARDHLELAVEHLLPGQNLGERTLRPAPRGSLSLGGGVGARAPQRRLRRGRLDGLRLGSERVQLGRDVGGRRALRGCQATAVLRQGQRAQLALGETYNEKIDVFSCVPCFLSVRFLPLLLSHNVLCTGTRCAW